MDHYLPLEILQLIYNCLDFTSGLRFRAVCRQWSSVSSSLVPLPKEPPWVFFPTLTPILGHVSSKSELFNLSFATRHKLFLPGVDWRRGTPVNVSGSHGTFLTKLSAYSDHSLYDPFSGQHVPLPRTDANVRRGYNPCITKLSCSPSPDAGRCMVAALMSSAGKHTQLYFCRLGDIHWISFTTLVDCIAFDDFAFHKGCLYAIDVSGRAILSSSNLDSIIPIPPWATIPLDQRGLLSPLLTDNANFAGNNYLVESDGELLLVRRLDNRHIARDVFFCSSWKL